jgi:transcription elongation factor Elf1
MSTKEILEELKCTTSDQQHFLTEPITLHSCGHSICKKSARKNSLKKITCKICGLESELDFRKIEASKSSQKLLKMCLEDVFKILEAEISPKLNEIKGHFKE